MQVVLIIADVSLMHRCIAMQLDQVRCLCLLAHPSRASAHSQTTDAKDVADGADAFDRQLKWLSRILRHTCVDWHDAESVCF
jgi:hypothetical protein